MLSSELRLGLVFGMLFIGLAVESLRPLRSVTQLRWQRVATNLGIAAVGALVMRLLFFPYVFELAHQTEANGWGILPRFDWVRNLPGGVQFLVSLLLLDYTLYVWHWLNHYVPFLWRFHLVHHVDLDMDVSTASRFHFGELALSAGYRSAQIVLFGIDPWTLVAFETLVTASAQFHHSNIRLPLGLERWLHGVIVTPRMHGIHHSVIEDETNSNFSTIFSIWDRIHGSKRPYSETENPTIGVAEYRDPRELTFLGSLALPFGSLKQKAQ